VTSAAPQALLAPAPPLPHRGRWSGRCPFCLRGFLVSAARFAYTCEACQVVIPAPAREQELATSELATRDQERGRAPIYEDYSGHRARDGGMHKCSDGTVVDCLHHLDGSAPSLAAEWGVSTEREDWDAGRPGAWRPESGVPEPMPPAVRAVAVLGRQDALLDEAIAAYTAITAGLVDVLKAIVPLGKALYLQVFGPYGADKPPKTRRAPRKPRAKAPAKAARGPPPSEAYPAAAERAVLRRVFGAARATDPGALPGALPRALPHVDHARLPAAEAETEAEADLVVDEQAHLFRS
jgi:hypothetical protein